MFRNKSGRKLDKYVFALDNAALHRAQEFKEFLEEAGLTILYLSFYSWDAASCESLFSYIERGHVATKMEFTR